MSIYKRLFLVILSALLTAVAIPNELLLNGSAILGLIALLPFYIALSTTNRTVVAAAFTSLFFTVTHIFSSFWLASFQGFAIFTLGASAGAYTVFGWLIGPIFLQTFKSPAHIRPWLFASLYVIWEWFKSTGFLGYPWGTLPMTVLTVPEIMQVADIVGTYGVTFLLAATAAVIAEFLSFYAAHRIRFTFSDNVQTRNTIFMLALLVASLTYGTVRVNEYVEPYTTVKAALIQHNADSWNGSASEALISAQKLTRECVEYATPRPEIIIWSESVLTRSYPQHTNYYERTPHSDPFIPFVQEINIPLLTGGPIVINDNPFRACNSALLLDENANLVDFYGKTQLVPFAENIPFIEHKWMQDFMMKIAGFSASWTPGKTQKIFPVKNATGNTVYFSTPICFEDAFAWVCRAQVAKGAEFFVNITNDSWSQTESAEIQHCVLSLYRAIECRRPLVRSTNSGVTCLVDRTGLIVQELPMFTQAAMTVTVPIYPSQETFYLRFGLYFPLLLFILSVVTITVHRKQNNTSKMLHKFI